MKKELGIFVILAIVCVTLAILSPEFITATNLQNNARLIGIYGIFAIGMGIVIMTGGIDLSVGSVSALLGVVLSMLLVEWKIPPFLAVLIVILLTTALGFLNGVLITKVKLQAFIVTLCGLLFYRGLSRYVTNDNTKGFGNAEGFETLKFLASDNIFGIPTPFILLLIIAVIMWVILHRSVWGRYLFAVGRNEIASKYSGINSDLMIISAYVVCGLLTGIAGVLLAFYTNSISPSSHGNSYELYAVAAAVLGGCSLRGGTGSIFGILVGTALLQVLRNLVNLLGIPSSLDFAVMGVVIMLGVLADQLLQGKRQK
ncbi:MAG: ABC transporter permease [Pyrinomonadaceae bacterium]|nr:ABC transporter permease [Pyrinomonadaceae bacterium]